MKKVILSGMRPTGRLHIGHYVGALENWIKLQNDYQNYHLIADYHVLTTNLNTDNIYIDSIDMLIDWLAAGLDPESSPMFRQSQIKEHCELQLIFGMLITVNRLERNPTLKEQVRDLNLEDQLKYGHLGYPVLQAADILLYKGNYVPVGEDQVPHVEISREIARKFNNEYGEVFPEPEPLLTRFPRLAGLDGKAKMSKSLDNTILLSDDPEKIQARLRKAVTDPAKVRKNDPGHPDICLIFGYHKKFNDPEAVQAIETDCRSGKLGCVECKRQCAAKLSEVIEPIRQKRVSLEQNIPYVLDVLKYGEIKAHAIAEATMAQVREKMKIG